MLMQAVDTYLAMRRAVGFALDHTEGYLRNFARFALARGDTHIIVTTAVEGPRTTSEAQRHNRLHTVIRFARFMAAEDSRHEIPPAGLFWGRRQRPMPYIFSENEIEQLLAPPAVSGRQAPYGRRPIAPCSDCSPSPACGCRRRGTSISTMSRAMGSSFAKPSSIRVVYSRSMSRPVWHSTAISTSGAEALVPIRISLSRAEAASSHTVVAETFHQVLKVAGIPHRPARRRLRLMDLRHTFAVRALEKSPETRDAVGRHTLALTTYMGHACVSDTYWYLETTPQLMTDIATACETFMQGGTS